MDEHFTGDEKRLTHFLAPYERKIIKALLPLVPSWVSTAHLTLMTLLWAALIVIFGHLATDNINWLWGFNACILAQYITDMLDGEVGRQRNTGLIKWGFYMDHFFDYVFLCATITGYSFLLPSSYSLLVLLWFGVSGGFMVHTLMDFAITKDYKISIGQFGVSEMRFFLIALNISLVILGKIFFVKVFPYIILSYSLALVAMVYKSQGMYRDADMRSTT
jgi:phosphatidylglycerophosphate synthase